MPIISQTCAGALASSLLLTKMKAWEKYLLTETVWIPDQEEGASRPLPSLKKILINSNNKSSSLLLLTYQKCLQDYLQFNLHSTFLRIIPTKQVFTNKSLLLLYKKWTPWELCCREALLLPLWTTLSLVDKICNRQHRRHLSIPLYLGRLLMHQLLNSTITLIRCNLKAK